MALNGTMRLTSEVQGEIKGSVKQAGREDSIMVVGYSHEVDSPRDAASGLPTWNCPIRDKILVES